jgi:hypothetical protein
VTSKVQPLAVVAPSLRIDLGPLELLLRCDGAGLAFDADWYYRPFVSPALDGATLSPEAVDVRFEIIDRPRACGPLLFESSALWSVRGEEDRRALVFRFPADTEPVFVLHLDLGSRSVRGECSARLVGSTDGGPVLDCSLLSYPLDQVLAMYLLGSEGFVLHAAGALVNGRGVALSGVSRAGKTTFSRLAHGRPGWEPLSDDRVILTTAAPPRVWGTPWPGEGEVAANHSGPTSWLLFLEKGETNAIRPLPAAEALRRLFQTASLPWYDAVFVAAGLAASEALLAAIPCGVLTFRPEIGAVEAVERLLQG